MSPKTHLNNSIVEKILSRRKGNVPLIVLSNMGLDTLPEGDLWSNLEHITTLVLDHNNLTQIPSSIARMSNLRTLFLSNNPLQEFPQVITEFPKLEYLKINGTKIEEIPESIGELQNLKWLEMNNNRIRKLPNTLKLLKELRHLDLRENKLSLPPELLNRMDQPSTILDYYFSHEFSPLNEAKMILVGQGGVGKTSVVNRFLFNKFDPEEEMTRGIAVTEWNVNTKSSSIHVHIWDFGGQEIMHATHQFFLTKRTLYIVVIDNRLDESENRLDYWLKIVQVFGENPPIILVGNKSDQRQLDIDVEQIKDKFPNLVTIIPVSCKTGDNIDWLRDEIIKNIENLPHVHDVLPKQWFDVKRILSSATDDYLSFEKYQDICVQNGIENLDDQVALLDFMHDLGTVLSYADKRSIPIQYTKVLNPEWVTKGVYQILNSDKIQKLGGIFNLQILRDVLPKSKYPLDIHCRFIIDMMKKFELCFSYEDDGNEYYLVPDLLRKTRPQEAQDFKPILTFEYRYDVLPNSIFPRFVVRKSQDVQPNLSWRNGVVLQRQEIRALVLIDRIEKIIQIKIEDTEKGYREYLTELRATLEDINSSFKNLTVKRFVRHPIRQELLVDFDYLFSNWLAKIYELHPPGSRSPIRVQDILDSYLDDQTVQLVSSGRITKIDQLVLHYNDTKINVYGDINFNAISSRQEFAEQLDKLQELIDREIGETQEKIASEVKRTLQDVIENVQGEKPSQKAILEKLQGAKELLSGLGGAASLVKLLIEAADVARKFFS